MAVPGYEVLMLRVQELAISGAAIRLRDASTASVNSCRSHRMDCAERIPSGKQAQDRLRGHREPLQVWAKPLSKTTVGCRRIRRSIGVPDACPYATDQPSW